MIYEFKRLALCIILIFSLEACSYIPEPKLQVASLELADAASLLGRLNSAAVEFSEQANRLALQTNLNLQYDLGGRPDANFPPLFEVSDLSTREQLLQKLHIYSHNISAALTANKDQKAPALTDFSSLKKVDLKVVGNLSNENLVDLAAKIDQFSGIYYYPKTIRELATLTDRMNPGIQRIVFLLYLDVGGLKDQSKTCSKNQLNPVVPVDVTTVPTCRNGLRALVNEALIHVVKTWQNRLKLALPKELKQSKSRPIVLDRIYQMQRFSENVDTHFQKLRMAYLHFANLHADFSNALLRKAELPTESEDYLSLQKRAVPDADYPASLENLLADFTTLTSKLNLLLKGERSET